MYRRADEGIGPYESYLRASHRTRSAEPGWVRHFSFPY